MNDLDGLDPVDLDCHIIASEKIRLGSFFSFF